MAEQLSAASRANQQAEIISRAVEAVAFANENPFVRDEYTSPLITQETDSHPASIAMNYLRGSGYADTLSSGDRMVRPFRAPILPKEADHVIISELEASEAANNSDVHNRRVSRDRVLSDNPFSDLFETEVKDRAKKGVKLVRNA